MSKRVADLVIETLQAAGVRSCYGIVGDTLNRIAHAIDGGEIDWVQMRHEEAGAFAAGAEALLTGRLTACAGSCGPGSLHFINGLYEANRAVEQVPRYCTALTRETHRRCQQLDWGR
jgi:pyruvate dehydrogenase (quinone)